MNVPDISTTMESQELRGKLAIAVRILAELHTHIGTIPYSTMSIEDYGMQQLRTFYKTGESTIKSLASDDIPF